MSSLTNSKLPSFLFFQIKLQNKHDTAGIVDERGLVSSLVFDTVQTSGTFSLLASGLSFSDEIFTEVTAVKF